MKNPPPLCTEAWLLVGLTGSLPGKLKLSAGRLCFTAYGSGTLWQKDLRRLAQTLAKPGLAERLESGKPALLLDVPTAEITVTFPWYYFSGGMKLTINGIEYRFSFAQPANTYLPVNGMGGLLREIRIMRSRGKAWKAALLEKSA